MRIPFILQQRLIDLGCPLEHDDIERLFLEGSLYSWYSPLGDATLNGHPMTRMGLVVEVEKRGAKYDRAYWSFDAKGAIVHCRVRNRSVTDPKEREQLYYVWARPIREAKREAAQ